MDKEKLSTVTDILETLLDAFNPLGNLHSDYFEEEYSVCLRGFLETLDDTEKQEILILSNILNEDLTNIILQGGYTSFESFKEMRRITHDESMDVADKTLAAVKVLDRSTPSSYDFIRQAIQEANNAMADIVSIDATEMSNILMDVLKHQLIEMNNTNTLTDSNTETIRNLNNTLSEIVKHLDQQESNG